MNRTESYERTRAFAALALGVGIATGILWNMGQRTFQRWSSYTNTIPQMIAEGRSLEARELYEDTWRDINQRLRDQRRDPVAFISKADVARLERDFNWEALIARSKTYQLTNQESQYGLEQLPLKGSR